MCLLRTEEKGVISTLEFSGRWSHNFCRAIGCERRNPKGVLVLKDNSLHSESLPDMTDTVAEFNQAIWPYSGHYLPTEENFREFIRYLEESGVDLSNVKVYASRFYFNLHIVFYLQNCNDK
jgi:hypothetical protein